MNINAKKIALVVAAYAALVFFSGCGASIEIGVENDDVAVAYRASFGHTLIDLMRTFSDDATAPLFGAAMMQAQFRESGIDKVNVASSSDESLSITTRFRAIPAIGAGRNAYAFA